MKSPDLPAPLEVLAFLGLIIFGFIANYLGHISLHLMDIHSAMRLQHGLIDTAAYEKEIRRTPMVRFGFLVIFLVIAIIAAMLVYLPESHRWIDVKTSIEQYTGK